MKGLSYTQRTLRYLRENGIIAEVVERWNPYAGPMINGRRVRLRHDLFNFIDIIALVPGEGIVAVQSTSGNCHPEHRRKIMDSEVTQNVLDWLSAGGKVQLISWSKKKLERGGKALRWFPRIEDITMENFNPRSHEKALNDDPLSVIPQNPARAALSGSDAVQDKMPLVRLQAQTNQKGQAE